MKWPIQIACLQYTEKEIMLELQWLIVKLTRLID